MSVIFCHVPPKFTSFTAHSSAHLYLRTVSPSSNLTVAHIRVKCLANYWLITSEALC